ncbi:diguanylate cyclase [Anoxybacterium hadale]
MPKIKRSYTIVTIIIMGIICSAMILFFLFSLSEMSHIYIGKTEETILELKKDFLKDTVSNLIAEIDNQRKAEADLMEKFTVRAAADIGDKMSLKSSEFSDFLKDYFNNTSEFKHWTVVYWDWKENKAIYDNLNMSEDSWEPTLQRLQDELAVYRILSQGDKTVLFGVKKSYLDDLVKAEFSKVVRNLEFNDGSYVWINEIINYEGGENYAIRKVHPNLPDTEGMYLSTDMTDTKGNHPYMTELQGIKKDGELYFSYYFKELDSDEISRKLTYAKLYKEFDWVVAMGIYQDDIKSYVDQTNLESKKLASKLTIVLVSMFIIILFLSYFVVLAIEKLHHRHSRRQLESEVNQDPMTKAGNRRSGTNELSRAFRAYKRNGDSPGIMMFDVDCFKNINDTYGHAVGDMVLIEIVNVINGVVRSSDKVIRWGGDEFLVIFYGLQPRNAMGFGTKMLSLISALNIEAKGEVISPTLSVGVAFFQEGDTDFSDALKRADQSLYQSKTNGRNQVHIDL